MDPAFAQEGAQISLEWLILSDDELVSCVDAVASDVEVAIQGKTEVHQTVSCFGGFAVVDTQAEGSPLVEVSLLSPTGERPVTVNYGEVELVMGATQPLGAIELRLTR